MIRRILTHILFSILLLGGTYACRQLEPVLPETTTSSDEVRVTIRMELPGDMKGPATRSITPEDEVNVSSLEVLAFTAGADNTYRYSYRAAGDNYNTGDGTFSTVLKQYPGDQVLVILINASNEQSASGIVQGDDLEAAMHKLVTSGPEEWKANNNGVGGYTPIPMYVRSAPQVITASTTNIGPLGVVKMLARIDVGLKESVTNFKLVNASLFNRQTAGYVAFDLDNWSDAGQKVFAAEVPTASSTIKIPSVMYQADATSKISGSIYTFESPGQIDRQNATALVVGGYFGYPANNDKISYYRIDIPATQNGYASGDILRNHLYNVVIQKVDNEGAGTPEEAFDGISRITATVTPWNTASAGMVFDAQYWLYVSHDRMDFSSGANGNRFSVATDCPDGIYITDLIDTVTGQAPAWITLQNLIGADGSMTRELTVSVTSNTTFSTRSAQFTLRVKNINYVVRVVQVFQIIYT